MDIKNFVHLRVHSDYSLLESSAKLGNLVEKAKSCEMQALALCDYGNMFGALNFYKLCKKNDIKPIIGEEFYTVRGDYKQGAEDDKDYFHLVLLCKNEAGYKNLCYLSSISFLDAKPYSKPCIDFTLLQKYHEGLVCLSAGKNGLVGRLFLSGKDDEAKEEAGKYAALFGEDYYLEVENHGLHDEKKLAEKEIAFSKESGIHLVLTNNIHYISEDDAEAHDVLCCIGMKKILEEPHRTLGNGLKNWYFKSQQEMASLFPDCREAVENTWKIAEKCNLTIKQYETQELKDCLPRAPIPSSFSTQEEYLRHLVDEGLKKRYSTVTEEIRKRADYELSIIVSMGFAGYFLIVWEFIAWAKAHNKPIGPGRGSGAGSLVAYALSITDIDPFRFGLIFERFLNPERVSMPDFDVDMDYDFRQDIIQHTRELYGEEQVAHIVTIGTLRAKQVIADVGRVLAIPLSEVNMLKKCIPDNPKATLKDAFTPKDSAHPDNGGLLLYKDEAKYKKLFEYAFKLENVNRNTGLHASGMVISLTPLPDWAPIFKDAKTGEVGVQYTMDIIEPCGLVKMDYLGLKTLSLIRYTEDIINKHKGENEADFKAENIRDDDKETFELFSRGDTIAVFQFESAGMQKILREAKPHRLEDLVALNALYRPGPMDFIPDFIKGKHHPETIHFPDYSLKDILEETYGVMVYQEQVMMVAQRIAGFSLGEADMLRRAMGKKKAEVLMGKQKEFVKGAMKRGFSEAKANEIFNIMIPFAGYGFNKSHAAAYSLIAYRTGYLKCHKAKEFMAANLTNEITSTDKLPFYINEAKRMGIEVDPPDVNRSDIFFDVVDGRIVFGLCGIKGIGEEAAKTIVSDRQKNGKYESYMDFLMRVAGKTDGARRLVNNKVIEVLIKTGAFDRVGEEKLNRETLLKNLESVIKHVESALTNEARGQVDLFAEVDTAGETDYVFDIYPEAPLLDKLKAEAECIGCYISAHPLDEYKSVIKNAVTLTSKNLRRVDGEDENAAVSKSRNTGPYTVLGMVSEVRVIQTKSMKEMAFVKLEDMDGTMDVTFFPAVWEVCKGSVEKEKVLALKGKADFNRDSPSLLVESVENIEELKKRAIQEVHIELSSGFESKDEISDMREFLLSGSGNCRVFFHIDIDGAYYNVNASSSVCLEGSRDNIEKIKTFPYVADAWLA